MEEIVKERVTKVGKMGGSIDWSGERGRRTGDDR